MAATLVASPVLAADSTTAPRPALIYQLPDSKRCGTLTTACDIPKDVNAGGTVNSPTVNSTNVTATGGVSAPVITAPGGGPIQANVTNAANAQNADKAKDADNAANATKADSATVATTANNLNPNAVVRGDQVEGAVQEAETATTLAGGGGELLNITYAYMKDHNSLTNLSGTYPAISGSGTGATITRRYYGPVVMQGAMSAGLGSISCTDINDGDHTVCEAPLSNILGYCQVNSDGTKQVVYLWNFSVYPLSPDSVTSGKITLAVNATIPNSFFGTSDRPNTRIKTCG